MPEEEEDHVEEACVGCGCLAILALVMWWLIIATIFISGKAFGWL